MKSPGRSVLFKNVITVSLLVAVVVGALSFFDLREILRIYGEQADALRKDGIADIKREGRTTTGNLAQGLKLLVIDNDYRNLDERLKIATREIEQILYIFVADEDGTILSQSGRAEMPEQIDPQAKQGNVPEPEEIEVEGTPAFRFVAPLISDQRYVGEVWMVYSAAALYDALKQIEVQKKEARDSAIQRSILFGSASLALGLLLAFGQSVQITRPVRQLAHRAAQIATGDLSARVRLKTRDEFGQLGATFNHMAERITELLEETKEKVTLQNEMEVARNVQDRLVAPGELIQRGNMQFAGFYQPASFCGGDFWNYFDLDKYRTMLIIADVTGHGVPSALITATAKACCDTLQATYGGEITVPRFMQTLNYVIYEAAKRHLQMTCFATLLDFEKKEMTYASAGHPMPYRCRMEGEKYTLQTLIARGNRLGDLPEWDFPAYTTDIQTSDVLIWFTDGITEGEDPRGEQWGEKRLRRTMQRNANRGPEQLRDHIVKTAFEFYQNRPPDDDITLVIGKAV